MIDFTKPVQTRDGRKVRILCTDRKDNRPIVGLVPGNGDEQIYSWHACGNYVSNEHCLDLINVPEKLVAYVNMYPRNGMFSVEVSPTKPHADSVATSERIACIRVEYEVGQYDD
jgi:hypothetical protein